MNDLGPYHVVITFGGGFRVHPDVQGASMLELEKYLRERGIPAEVYKATKADDSKVRLLMTEEKRAKL